MAEEKWSMPTRETAPATEKGAEAQRMADNLAKKHSKFFAAVRARGILNSMLDGPIIKFDSNNPGQRARWEYAPPGGDKMMVVAREGLGFHVVDAIELGETTESGQKSGPVQVGDLILMAAPDHIVAAIEMEDARAAYEDFKLPVQSYRDHIRGIKARLRDGTDKETEPVGDVKLHQEIVQAPGAGLDHDLETE